MKLLGPNTGISWNYFRNVTPTFELTPVEKPDLSPFLIHMTGKNSLVKILKGEGKPNDLDIPQNCGYLKSVIPSFDGREGCYNSAVVCFTESPIFTLDFFRYRSYTRWNLDQQYGIGFSKSFLIKHYNVRPVIYIDSSINSQLLNLCNNIINEKVTINNENGEILTYKNLFTEVKSLLFPLLENTQFQGFMWEREWRNTNKQGMIFSHEAIKLICCPKNEKNEILSILGERASKIEIVENWKEYDEVTNYLKRRQKEATNPEGVNISEIKDFEFLHELKNQNERTLNTLEEYYAIFKETVTSLERNSIHGIIDSMKEKTIEIDVRIKELSEELKVKNK